LVAPLKTRDTNLHDGHQESLEKESIQKFLQSDKIKYQKALALQKLKDDPNGVFIDIKYHFAWNVIHRKPVFKPTNETFDFFYDTFLKCNDLVGAFVSLLWLAPDHVHLYVNSDGERSVETMVQEIKRYSNKAILSGLNDIKERLNGIDLWDVSYFSQTIG